MLRMSQSGARPAVLVVDDEPHILSSMTALLEEDFSVVTSTDALAALGLLGDESFAVIIADQRMPGLPGDEFLAKAKLLSGATRVLITGYADISALIRAVNQGQIYTYVAKPWEPLQLKFTITQAAQHCLLEKEIMRERDLLHGLMDHIPDLIWFKDAKGQFTRVNNSTARFFGVNEPSLVIGKSASDFFRPEEAREIEAEERGIRLERTATNRIHKLHWSDGVGRWMSTTKAPIAEKSGEVTALVGVSRDVTDQKEAELALQESEERYRQIVETTEEGVWIFDENLRTVIVNQKMAAMLGLHPADIERRPIADFLAGEDQELQLDLFKRNAEGNAPSPADLHLKKKDGGVIWTIAASSPMLDAWGQHTGTLAMVTDITQRKALEEQVRQAQKLEAVGRFAGGVAHDFNNVLTVITGHSQLLLRRLEADSPLRSQLEKIEAAAHQAANLTRQLLTFSRRRIAKPEVMGLNAAVLNFQKLCLPIIGDDVELITKLDPRLGRVRADAGQIDQVLMNLAVNARDAMPRGGTVTIGTANVDFDSTSPAVQGGEQPGPYVLLEVRDTGCGMDAVTQNRVFEPFFTTKEEGKGTGLGLSTVHGIVRQHGGWIEVKSELGHGTCFRIYLPRVTELEAAKPSAPSAEWPRGSETILVVEDRAPLRELVRESLTSFGYEVLEAGDGQEGLEILERGEKRIDLVVTDVIMPRLNGREFAKLVKERHPETRLLYMSGYGGDNPAAEALDSAELLQKPFTTEALLRKVRSAIDAREAPKRIRQSILVVDDEEEIRDLLRSILEEDGHQVLTAENGKQAIALLKTAPVKLMVTDLAMPEQEGMETIALARRDYPDLQIIAMSGAFERSILSVARHLGAHTVLEKPVQVDEVLKLVHNLLTA